MPNHEHPNNHARPHVKLNDWSTAQHLDLTTVTAAVSSIRTRVGRDLTREQASDMLRSVEQQLMDGKLTRNHDNAMQILAEIRAAQHSIGVKAQEVDSPSNDVPLEVDPPKRDGDLKMG